MVVKLNAVLIATKKPRRLWDNKFKRVRENNCQSRIIDLGKMFQGSGWNKNSFRQIKVEKVYHQQTILKEFLTNVVQEEEK